MTKLEILDASWHCGIDDNDIQNINLKELYAFDNPRITDVKHMTKLEILDTSSN